MAAKGNQAVSINRECVEAFASTIATYANTISNQVISLKDSVRYLTDESNVGGNDSEGYRNSVQASYDGLLNVQSKLETISKVTARISESYGITASSKKRSIEECLTELQSYSNKLKGIS